jgi:outer membrane protein assembly factor BamB
MRVAFANDRLASVLVTATAIALALGSLGAWFVLTPARYVTNRVPRPEEEQAAGPSEAAIMPEPTAAAETFFRAGDGKPSQSTAAWPQFRGVHRDNVDTDDLGLAEYWPEGGPEVLWSVDLGEGYAGPAVLNGRVYVLDYDEQEQGDCLRCLSLDDGKEIWRRWYKEKIKRNHGISRTVPAVTAEHVVTVGPTCRVMCVDARSGDLRWHLDMVTEYGATVPLWYTGQCPLIDDGLALLAPCGKALMIAVDCATGEVVWQTPNPANWTMSHSSIVPMLLYGRRVYVYCAVNGMAAVAADGDERGSVLWQTSAWANRVTAPSPVSLGDGRIFVTAGQGAGSMMLRVVPKEGAFSVEPLYRLDKTVFACEQQTPLLLSGHLLGVLPKDAGDTRTQLVCLNPDTGVPVWSSGKEHTFGLGPYLLADGKIFVLGDDGVLALLKASVKEYVQLDQARVLHGRDAWGPMALVDGRLLVRDSKRMVCVAVAARQRADKSSPAKAP